MSHWVNSICEKSIEVLYQGTDKDKGFEQKSKEFGGSGTDKPVMKPFKYVGASAAAFEPLLILPFLQSHVLSCKGQALPFIPQMLAFGIQTTTVSWACEIFCLL